MRILLQQQGTGLYFKDTDAWSRESSEAMSFVSAEAAGQFCTASKLTGVQVVLKFDEQRCDIVLPAAVPQDLGRERLRPSA
jgi:hypothetical protein